MYTYIEMVHKYYEKKNKEKLQKEARDRDQSLSEEEKEKRPKKAQGRYKKNLFEDEKKRKVEYMRNYYLAHKK